MDAPLRSPPLKAEHRIPPPLTTAEHPIPVPPRGPAVVSPLRDPQNRPFSGWREPAVSSQTRAAEDRTPQNRPLAGRREPPVSSPTREAAEHPTPQRHLPFIYQLARDGSLGSPVSSPLGRSNAGAPEGSPHQSPAREPDSPTTHRNFSVGGSPARSPLRSASRNEGAAGSPLRPPPEEMVLLALPPPEGFPEKPASPVAAAHRLLRDELGVMTKEEGRGAGGRVAARGEGEGPMDGVRWEPQAARQGVVLRRAARKADLGLRLSGMVLCLVSFSVMAADKTVGWAGDSFDRYKEFRYLVSVNVIAFVYSMFQVYVHVHYIVKKKYIISRPIKHYFNFTMDQLLAYLLMSASSSAATRNDAWVDMFGGDDFTYMANGSIAMSFLAFVALALSSLFSSYSLFRLNS